MNLWLVMSDAGGAHEPSCVYSVWDSRSLAADESCRLEQLQPGGGGTYGGRFYIQEATLNTPKEEWIE